MEPELSVPRSPRTYALAAMVGAAVAALVLAVLPAPVTAETIPEADAGDLACTEALRTGAPFTDVEDGATHAAAISCLWAYGVAAGTFTEDGQVFRPGVAVTREQMTSFLARTLDQLPAMVAPLPDLGAEPTFADAGDISGVHVDSVVRLTDLGVVQGFVDETFRPRQSLTRAQMATFLVRAVEEVLGEELDREVSFDDVSGTHQASVEKLATIGIVQGRAPGLFAPDDPIERQQMASLLTRSLGYFVGRGLMQPVSFQPGEPGSILGLTDVDAAIQEGFDRVTFTLAGDERDVGWRVRYVEDAREDGSGNPVEVAGDAILEVRLEGMGMPFDLPSEVEEELWDEGRASLDGPAIVEIVDSGVFEGQQVLFIGTRGLLPFAVDRLADPQRIYIDVDHPA